MQKGFRFNWEVDVGTLIMICALLGQGFVMFHRVGILEKNQNDMRESFQTYTEKNNEAHTLILQNAAKTAAILDLHVGKELK